MLVVGHHLLVEDGTEEIQADIGIGRSPEWQVECRVAAESPGILEKVPAVNSGEGLAGREDSDIVN